MKRVTSIVLAASFCAALGCSDSATETDSGAAPAPSASSAASGAPKAGEVVVNVKYSGTKKGAALSVALFTDFPPKGPPAGVTAARAPLTFPTTLRVPNVAAGTYVAVVRLTAEGNDPQAQSALPGDLQAASTPLTLAADKGASADVELADK